MYAQYLTKCHVDYSSVWEHKTLIRLLSMPQVKKGGVRMMWSCGLFVCVCATLHKKYYTCRDFLWVSRKHKSSCWHLSSAIKIFWVACKWTMSSCWLSSLSCRIAERRFHWNTSSWDFETWKSWVRICVCSSRSTYSAEARFAAANSCSCNSSCKGLAIRSAF